MDELIDEWPIVSVNRIHLGLLAAALLKLSEGAYRGELQRMDWFTIGGAGLDPDVKHGSIDYSNRILLFYSVWAIVDLVMYFRHHPFLMWALNCVHHIFRIFLLATSVIGSAVCIWEAICQVTYCVSCSCLYLKIGLLVDERQSSRMFRRIARYSFYASIVTRLMGYTFGFYWNFVDTFHQYPVRTGAIFSIYFLFDAAYLTFHCLPHPPKDKKENKVKQSAVISASVSPDQSNVGSVLCDIFDRELFYPFGEGMVGPLRSVGLTPNLVTFMSGAVQLLGLYFLAIGQMKIPVLACVFLGYTLDCVDGQMARRYSLVSDFGAMLDTGKDALVTAMYFIALYVRHGIAVIVPLLVVAFTTVARGGLVSNGLPFQLCYKFVRLFPTSLQTPALSCHGGVFTMTLMFVILFAV